MSQVWTRFADAAQVAKELARVRGEIVEIRRLPEGWDIPDYCSWVGELDPRTPYDDYSEYTATTGLSPPDWEDGSPDEVSVAYGGAYVHAWDID
jgi:hypothetical protein